MKNIVSLLIICLVSVIPFGCDKGNETADIPADMFCITALEGGLDVSMELYDENYPHTAPSLLYSTDGQNWSDFIIGETIVHLSASGAIFYMKAGGHNVAFACEAGSDAPFIANYHAFKFSKKAKVSGNIMYLLDGEHPQEAEMGELAFFGLFLRDSLLMDASELLLPSRQLSAECYAEMFEHTSISIAPELPATELAPYCYSSMFYECRNMTLAPELPATRLDTACYKSMFCDCPCLAAAPELPAVQLSQQCYSYMFDGCTALTEGPELPASKLEPYCYYHMFTGCISMTALTCSATDISAERCVSGWLKNIDTNGTLYAAPGTDWTGRIPATWTVKYSL